MPRIVSRLLAAFTAPLLALLLWRVWRFRRQEAPTGGPLIIVLADGVLLKGRFLAGAVAPARSIQWTAIGTHSGAGDPQWEFTALSLQPAGTNFAVGTIETFRDGFDMRVSLHDSDTGRIHFSYTDNSYPTTLWQGDDPAAPAKLLFQQSVLDADWEEWKLDDPDVPRPVAQARFVDPAADGELFFSGWTAAGHALLLGRSRLEITSDVFGADITDLAPWWGVAGPLADGSWDWIARDHGAPPAIHAPVPRPPLARLLALSGTQLLVDGVAQTDPALAPGVVAFDGPFS